MTPMDKKKKRRGKLLLILLVLGDHATENDMNTLAINQIYNHDYEEDLSSEEMAVTEPIDELYQAYDPLDDPDNFDENGDLPEVDRTGYVETFDTAVENL